MCRRGNGLLSCLADEGVHQGAERAAVQQRGGSPERAEVGTKAWTRVTLEHPR